MKRQEKYPETSTFHYYNANPKDKITSDCVIRALATGMEQNYILIYGGVENETRNIFENSQI